MSVRVRIAIQFDMFEKIVNNPGEVGQSRIIQVFQHIITMKSVKGSIVFITFLQRQSNALVARRRGHCSSGGCIEMSHLGFLSPKEEERRRKWKFLKESEGRLAEFGDFACQQSETLVPRSSHELFLRHGFLATQPCRTGMVLA